MTRTPEQEKEWRAAGEKVARKISINMLGKNYDESGIAEQEYLTFVADAILALPEIEVRDTNQDIGGLIIPDTPKSSIVVKVVPKE